MLEYHGAVQTGDITKRRGRLLEAKMREWEKQEYSRMDLGGPLTHTVMFKDKSGKKPVGEIIFVLDYCAAIPGMEDVVYVNAYGHGGSCTFSACVGLNNVPSPSNFGRVFSTLV